jgi:hypothetical protein
MNGQNAAPSQIKVLVICTELCVDAFSRCCTWRASSTKKTKARIRTFSFL